MKIAKENYGMFRNPKCCICGKFVSYEADQSVDMGDSTMSEPPDPEFYCPKCAEYEKNFFRKAGWIPSHYQEPHWCIELAKEMGFEKRMYSWTKISQ